MVPIFHLECSTRCPFKSRMVVVQARVNVRGMPPSPRSPARIIPVEFFLPAISPRFSTSFCHGSSISPFALHPVKARSSLNCGPILTWHYFCVEGFDSDSCPSRRWPTRSWNSKRTYEKTVVGDQPILMGPSHGAADSLGINGDLAGTHLLFRRLTYAQSNRVLPLHMLDVKISVP